MQLHADVQLHWARAVHRRPAVHNRGVVMYVLLPTKATCPAGCPAIDRRSDDRLTMTATHILV
jgi:hypothetical protein